MQFSTVAGRPAAFGETVAGRVRVVWTVDDPVLMEAAVRLADHARSPA